MDVTQTNAFIMVSFVGPFGYGIHEEVLFNQEPSMSIQ